MTMTTTTRMMVVVAVVMITLMQLYIMLYWRLKFIQNVWEKSN